MALAIALRLQAVDGEMAGDLLRRMGGCGWVAMRGWTTEM
jgi:hypothetical protein